MVALSSLLLSVLISTFLYKLAYSHSNRDIEIRKSKYCIDNENHNQYIFKYLLMDYAIKSGRDFLGDTDIRKT